MSIGQSGNSGSIFLKAASDVCILKSIRSISILSTKLSCRITVSRVFKVFKEYPIPEFIFLVLL